MKTAALWDKSPHLDFDRRGEDTSPQLSCFPQRPAVSPVGNRLAIGFPHPPTRKDFQVHKDRDALPPQACDA